MQFLSNFFLPKPTGFSHLWRLVLVPFERPQQPGGRRLRGRPRLQEPLHSSLQDFPKVQNSSQSCEDVRGWNQNWVKQMKHTVTV